MDSQIHALFDSPTIDKSGIGEVNLNSLKPKKSEKKERKSHKSENEQESVEKEAGNPVTEKELHKVPSFNALRRQRFVIQPLNEPGPSQAFGPKLSSEVAPTSPMTLTPLRPVHHTSMKSILSGIHLSNLQSDPQQRTIGPLCTQLTPQLLHLARSGSTIFSEGGSTRLFTDATSVRSLASFGLGVTDGKRMIIRKVPNSPAELIQLINPPL